MGKRTSEIKNRKREETMSIVETPFEIIKKYDIKLFIVFGSYASGSQKG